MTFGAKIIESKGSSIGIHGIHEIGEFNHYDYPHDAGAQYSTLEIPCLRYTHMRSLALPIL